MRTQTLPQVFSIMFTSFIFSLSATYFCVDAAIEGYKPSKIQMASLMVNERYS